MEIRRVGSVEDTRSSKVSLGTLEESFVPN